LEENEVSAPTCSVLISLRRDKFLGSADRLSEIERVPVDGDIINWNNIQVDPDVKTLLQDIVAHITHRDVDRTLSSRQAVCSKRALYHS
jgi:hypothetical protein